MKHLYYGLINVWLVSASAALAGQNSGLLKCVDRHYPLALASLATGGSQMKSWFRGFAGYFCLILVLATVKVAKSEEKKPEVEDALDLLMTLSDRELKQRQNEMRDALAFWNSQLATRGKQVEKTANLSIEYTSTQLMLIEKALAAPAKDRKAAGERILTITPVEGARDPFGVRVHNPGKPQQRIISIMGVAEMDATDRGNKILGNHYSFDEKKRVLSVRPSRADAFRPFLRQKDDVIEAFDGTNWTSAFRMSPENENVIQSYAKTEGWKDTFSLTGGTRKDFLLVFMRDIYPRFNFFQSVNRWLRDRNQPPPQIAYEPRVDRVRVSDQTVPPFRRESVH